MIEINLLPEELKTKATKGKINSQNLLQFIPFVFGILVFCHVCLAAVSILKHCQYSVLHNKWEKLRPQREKLKNFKDKYDILSTTSQVVQQLNDRRLNWSEKLNKLSLNLPSGIWFNELLVSRTELILKGSVISLHKEEMSLINKFIDSLKNDSAFFRDFNSLELSSVQRKLLAGYDIVDFILTVKLKSR